MKFTPEEIAKQRGFYDSTMTNKDCIVGYDGCKLIALEPGPDDGKPEYYIYATFYDEEDAKYAYYAITTHADVLEEVERLREALESLRETEHYECEDCFYSCPKTGACFKEVPDYAECTCGMDRRNAIIDKALKGGEG